MVQEDLVSAVDTQVEAEASAVVCLLAVVAVVMAAPSLQVEAVTRQPATHLLLWPLLEAAASHPQEAVAFPISAMSETVASSMWLLPHLPLAFLHTNLLPLHPFHLLLRLPHLRTTVETIRFAFLKEAAVEARDSVASTPTGRELRMIMVLLQTVAKTTTKSLTFTLLISRPWCSHLAHSFNCHFSISSILSFPSHCIFVFFVYTFFLFLPLNRKIKIVH